MHTASPDPYYRVEPNGRFVKASDGTLLPDAVVVEVNQAWTELYPRQWPNPDAWLGRSHLGEVFPAVLHLPGWWGPYRACVEEGETHTWPLEVVHRDDGGVTMVRATIWPVGDGPPYSAAFSAIDIRRESARTMDVAAARLAGEGGDG